MATLIGLASSRTFSHALLALAVVLIGGTNFVVIRIHHTAVRVLAFAALIMAGLAPT